MSSFNFLLGANVFIFLQNFPFNFLILYTLSRIIKFSASVDTRRQMATESGQFIHHSWQTPSIHHSWRRPRGRASTAGFCRRGRWVWAARCRPSSPPGWCQTSETELYVRYFSNIFHNQRIASVNKLMTIWHILWHVICSSDCFHYAFSSKCWSQPRPSSLFTVILWSYLPSYLSVRKK